MGGVVLGIGQDWGGDDEEVIYQIRSQEYVINSQLSVEVVRAYFFNGRPEEER